MIKGFVRGDKEVVAYFARIPGDVRSQLRFAVGRLVLRLQRKIQQEKLTGQVLKVRTGTLRRSISHAVVEQGDAIVGTASTNVEYARVHEFGFKGPMPVKSHVRLVKQAFGRELKTPVWATVGAHTRNVDLPERSFMRSALAEMAPEIEEELRRAVEAGVRQ